jgi:transcriptional regulator with XRE-family HTH domain
MNMLYERISMLCTEKGIRPGKMCTDLGISRGNISDLKMGRIESLSADKLSKISAYFNVSVDYLLTGEETKKAPTGEGEREVSDDDIKFALFGGDGEITDAMYDEVKRFAHMVKLREEAEKGNK